MWRVVVTALVRSEGHPYQREYRHGGHQRFEVGLARSFCEVGSLEEVEGGALEPNPEPLECPSLSVQRLVGCVQGPEGRRPIIPCAL